MRGLAAMLAPFSDRVAIVEIQIGGAAPEVRRRRACSTHSRVAGYAIDRAREMVHDGYVDHVLLYTWDAAAEFLTLADEAGVSGVALKSQTGRRLGRRHRARRRGRTHRFREHPTRSSSLGPRSAVDARTGSAGAHRVRDEQRRDRPRVVPVGRHGQDLRPPAVRQVGCQESSPGCVARSETQRHAAGNAAWPTRGVGAMIAAVVLWRWGEVDGSP